MSNNKSKSKSKKKVKSKKTKVPFIELLEKKLSRMNKGKVTMVNEPLEGYLEIEIKGKHLVFCFDDDGENIESIGLYEDIIGVTGQNRVFTINKDDSDED